MNQLFFSKTRRFFSLSLLMFTVVAVFIQINIFYILLKENIISLSFSNNLSYRPREIIILLIIFAVFSSIISIFLATYVNSKILDPLEKLSEAMQSVVDGDLNIRVTDKSSIEEVNGLFDNFNRMVTALQANEEISKQMIENISHEMKTPLSAIKGYAQILEGEIEEAEAIEMLQSIEIAATHLSKMTQQMTQLTKLENQSLNIIMAPFNLTEQIRQVILEFQNEWEIKNLVLEIDLEEVTYKGNEEYLYHVWRNVIENAIKYNLNNGLLAISLKEEGSNFVIQFSNSSVDLTPSELENMMQRFYQSDASRLSDGTGLGVPIAKRIVELHQGSFEIIKAKDHHISVVVHLPQK